MLAKKMSLGKKLGLIAFIISELLTILIIVGMVFKIVTTDFIPALLTFQGSVFVTVFAGVSTKNFKKISGVSNE